MSLRKFPASFRIDEDTYTWLLEISNGQPIYNVVGELIEKYIEMMSDEEIVKRSRKRMHRLVSLPLSAKIFKRIIDLCDKYNLEKSEIFRAVVSYAREKGYRI